jgi:hypothetical protein
MRFRSLSLAWFVSIAWGCNNEAGPGTCLVARHVDQCCSTPIAVSQQQLDQDPCLQRWDRAVDVTRCPAAKPCSLRTCDEALRLAPWTRLAGANGSNCVLQDECSTDSDCTFATNRSRCCACPEWVPKALSQVDACYVTSGQSPSAACDACEDVLPCEACPSVAAGHCVADAGYRKCLL